MVLKPIYELPTPSAQQRQSFPFDAVERPAFRRGTSLSHSTEESAELKNVVVVPTDSDMKTADIKSTDMKTDDKPTDHPGALNPNHRIKYKDIVEILRDNYHFDENKNSTALDILALYLKGQKIIYMESKTHCEKRLNTLMLPAILLAAVCSILNFILKDYSYGTIIISSLNASNSFILSIINYLKLAEKSQNHLMAAHRFSSLESRLELQSGHSLFFHNSVAIEKSLEEMEKEIKEIQSSNQFLIPEAIRYRYPKIFSSNIFSLVKEIKNEEILCINELKSAVQKIREHTNERDELLKKQIELTSTINGYRDDLHKLQLNQEITISTIDELDQDKDNIEIDESIVLWSESNESSIEPPTLEIPADNLSAEELYQQIHGWKEKYDKYVARNKGAENYSKQVTTAKKQNLLNEKHQLRRELMRTVSGLKTNIKHFELCLEEAKYTLQEVEKSIEHEKDEIDRYDSKKDKAFEKIVKHRQRYIELSDDINREINQHISKKKRCCTCNPCEFFNN